ncbi:MAG: DUF4783 domain-containing protein [Saprospiraceae bacterium]|nr:DUF4783 domain-containing protein [Saprospiraceae bacterium]
MRYSMMVLLTFCGLAVQSQGFNTFLDHMRKSDMAAMSELMDQRMQYCFNDQIEIADKSVVIKALKAFLDRNAPKSIQPVHKGNAKGEDSSFSIAQMDAQNGRKYRIYLYGELVQNKFLIKELRIDPL